jgi:hypothetical protein
MWIMIKTTQHVPQDPQVRDIVFYSNYQPQPPPCEHQRELECFGNVDRGMNIVAAKVDFQRKIREVIHAAPDEAIEANFILEKGRVLVKDSTSTADYIEIDINKFDEEVVESIHDVLRRANQAWKGCGSCKGEGEIHDLHGRVHELEAELAQERERTQAALQTVREQQGSLDRLSQESSAQAQWFSEDTQSFRRQLEARDAEIMQLRSALQRDQAALREMTSARDAALVQNESDARKIAELERSILEKTETIADLEKRNESLQSENERLIEDHELALQNLRREYDEALERQALLLEQARGELGDTQELLERAQREHAEQIEVHQAKLLELVRALEHNLENLEAYIDQLKKQHENAQRELLESLQGILGEMKEEVSKDEPSSQITEEQLRKRKEKEEKLKKLPLPEQITQIFAELKTNFSILKAKMNVQEARIVEQDDLIADLTKPPMEQFELEEEEKPFSLLGFLGVNASAPETKPKNSVVARQQAQIRRAELQMQKLQQDHSRERLAHREALSVLERQLQESREKFEQLQWQIINTEERRLQDTMKKVGGNPSQISLLQPAVERLAADFTPPAESLKRQVAGIKESDITQSA